MSKENKGRLEDWWIDNNLRGGVVNGRVYGHPTFKDGVNIRTSTIVDFLDDNNKVETRNSIYTLGVAAVIMA